MTLSHRSNPKSAGEKHSSAEQPSADPSAIAERVTELRRAFDTGRTRSHHWRGEQLRSLRAMCVEHEDEICDALALDLGRPRLESTVMELSFTLGAIDDALANMSAWMRPERVKTPLITQPSVGEIHNDPLGVVLIISPWNYPFTLCTGPLVAALAAGNCAVLKPSEVTPHTSALLARLIPQYLDPSCVAVFEGGVPETTAILAQRFDHIFYTGNGTVGRIVATAAAKNLTPVTLELGGKSPVFVNNDANLDVAVKRIAWGKWANAGQTCVAPDYVLVHRDIYDVFVGKLADTVREFYGHDPQVSPDYGRIVNTRHHRRIMALMDGGDIVVGGEADEADRYIAPTVLKNVDIDSPIMRDEIFGPLLPILPVEDINEAVRFINQRPKPLALYVFTEDDGVADDIVKRTSSGALVVNHSYLHLAVHELPFGGVGESGSGAYHGQFGFDTFTHKKSVLRKNTALDPTLLYPPFGAFKKMVLKMLA